MAEHKWAPPEHQDVPIYAAASLPLDEIGSPTPVEPRGATSALEGRQLPLKQPKACPKGRKRRTVPVPDWTLEHLHDLVVARRRGFIFMTSDGTPLDHHNYRSRVWIPAVKRAGFDEVHLHDARHTYASLLIQDGVPLEEGGRLLGHVSPLTTRRYAHLAKTPSVAVLGALSRPEARGAGHRSGRLQCAPVPAAQNWLNLAPGQGNAAIDSNRLSTALSGRDAPLIRGSWVRAPRRPPSVFELSTRTGD